MDERSIEQLRLDIMASCTAPDLLDAFEYRIRAEARAEALRGASDKICEACIDEWGAQEPCPYRLNWTIDKCKIRNALCLADEPKEERGAEGHNTSQPCPRCGVVPFLLAAAPITPGIASAYRAVCASCGHPVSATFSFVERRIEEAGR